MVRKDGSGSGSGAASLYPTMVRPSSSWRTCQYAAFEFMNARLVPLLLATWKASRISFVQYSS